MKKLLIKGHVCAVRTRVTKANGWMPEVCFARLEGDPDPRGKFLQVCGWSIEPDKSGWLVKRLERCLPKLAQQWAEDYGKSWRLEIR